MNILKESINQLLASKSLRAVDKWINSHQDALTLYCNSKGLEYVLLSTDKVWCISICILNDYNQINVVNRTTTKHCVSKQRISSIGKRTLQNNIIRIGA